MRRILIRGTIAIACLGALLIAWVVVGRPLSLWLDRLHTVVIDAQPVARLGVEDVDRGMLRINNLPMTTAMPDYGPFPMEMKLDPARQFVVQSGGHSIVLGKFEGSPGKSDGVGIRPGPGDQVQFRIERSMLSWPTPLDINFMSGHSPSWKRHVYYRLVWKKPNGGRLEMVWRYEQYFYDDWASGFMTRAGTTGLIRVDIRP